MMEGTTITPQVNVSGSNWFQDLLGTATQIGTSWLQTEAYKDVLEDTVRIRQLESQLNQSQANSTATQTTASTATAETAFDWKPWAIGAGVLVGLAVAYRVAVK